MRNGTMKWTTVQRVIVTGVVVTVVTTLVPVEAEAEPGDLRPAPAVLLAPMRGLGKVRMLRMAAIARALKAMMRFSTTMRVVDAGTTRKIATPTPPKKTPLADRIARADRRRARAHVLAAKSFHTRAYQLLMEAIADYEAASGVLVDFSKLADAYARAGVSGWYAHKGVGIVMLWFRRALALQPTLVIDRRRLRPDLVVAFEAARTALRNSPTSAIVVAGSGGEAHVFIDGIDVGPVPAGRTGLHKGAHFVQVRDRGRVLMARRVWVRGQKVRLKVRARSTAPSPSHARKNAEVAKRAKRWRLADLAGCDRARTTRCRRNLRGLAAQTGADYVVFPSLEARKSGQLRLRTTLVDTTTGKRRHTTAVAVAPDLADLHARIGEAQRSVAHAVVARSSATARRVGQKR